MFGLEIRILSELETPTNPAREESQTTVGNPHMDYEHELIMNALHAAALLYMLRLAMLCFAVLCLCYDLICFLCIAMLRYVLLSYACLRCALLWSTSL